MIWINGQIRDDTDALLSWSDPGFVSGATVVDNCRTWGGKLFRWSDHVARLRHDCEACSLPLHFLDHRITAAALTLMTELKDDAHIITFVTPQTMGMYAKPVDHARNQQFYRTGITLKVAGYHPAVPDLSILSPHVKHRSRMVWHIADAMARKILPTALGVLLDRPEGTLTETSIGNILAVIDGAVVIPPRKLVLDGIGLRASLEFCELRHFKIIERELTLRELATCSEMMLTGSGFGLCGITQVDAVTIPFPGPITRMLMQDWATATGVELK